MYLTEKYHLSSFSPFRNTVKPKHPLPVNLDLICRTFDENMLRRLENLKSVSEPSLIWLSSAVDFLSSTHDEAQILISDLEDSCAVSDDSFALYLDHSVKLLDLCNLISSEIERLRQRRLLINFVLHLLRNPNGEGIESDKIRRAGEDLSDLECYSRGNLNRKGFHVQDPEALVRELAVAVGRFPHGKVSTAGKAIQRTIYAVGLVTEFVAGVAVSALYRVPEIGRVPVPDEFLWAKSFNGLQSSTLDEMKRHRFAEGRNLTEVNEVGNRAEKLRQVINGGEEERKQKLETAVKELETAKEALSKGIDSLSNGVDVFFHKVLNTRTGVLNTFRLDKYNDKGKK